MAREEEKQRAEESKHEALREVAEHSKTISEIDEETAEASRSEAEN